MSGGNNRKDITGDNKKASRVATTGKASWVAITKEGIAGGNKREGIGQGTAFIWVATIGRHRVATTEKAPWAQQHGRHRTTGEGSWAETTVSCGCQGIVGDDKGKCIVAGIVAWVAQDGIVVATTEKASRWQQHGASGRKKLCASGKALWQQKRCDG